MDELLYLTDSYGDAAAGDVALSHALLEAVAAGSIGPVFRLHVPAKVLAFGMADRIQPGYARAVQAASAHGYQPIERLAGGRAAVFDSNTLAFSWAMQQADPKTGIRSRFEAIADLLNRAFLSLALDTRVGQVPGEYCPGEFSINLGGRTKVMGVGQRLTKAAAHVGGVVVVDGPDSIRDVLIPVYRALQFDWDPRTVGALADRSPGLAISDVQTTIRHQLGLAYQLDEGVIPESIVARSMELRERHIPKLAQ